MTTKEQQAHYRNSIKDLSIVDRLVSEFFDASYERCVVGSMFRDFYAKLSTWAKTTHGVELLKENVSGYLRRNGFPDVRRRPTYPDWRLIAPKGTGVRIRHLERPKA